MKPKILATASHTGGANAIIPVLQRLQGESIVNLKVIGNHDAKKVFEKKGIVHKTLGDYNLQDSSLESAINLLSYESPNLIFNGTSDQDRKNKRFLAQNINLAGKIKNISTLAVLDTWGRYSQRFDDLDTGEHLRFLPDKIAILDEYAEKKIVSEGFPKERLVITGNPHYDDLEAKARNFTEKEKSEIRERIGLGSESLFFFPCGTKKSKEKELGFWTLDGIRVVDEVLKEFPEEEVKRKYGFFIKLHPGFPQEDNSEILNYVNKNSEGRVKMVSDIEPRDLILASDLTINQYSTLGAEAVYMGKPCISLQPNLSGEDIFSYLTEEGIVPVGYTPKECKNLVRKCLVDEDYRARLQERTSKFKNDGKATKRVANLIYSMLGLKG